MSRVLIIGAGGVGGVVTHKCMQCLQVFSGVILASRTLSKCEAISNSLENKVETFQVDADNVSELVALIDRVKPDLVIHVALPYQDLAIMEACLQTSIDYLDTANYESPDQYGFEYKEQWAYHERFKDKGIMALLGCGFDPGVTNIFCAYAQKHLFDEIHTIDIIDCNDGDHGQPFATNFNAELNIREITQPGKYWENGQWVETAPMEISQMINFPGIGPRKGYLLYHEEEESLVKHIRGLKRIRFWMTFSEAYLTHLSVFRNVGLTRIDPVEYEGHKIIPLQFLNALLPNPGSLAENYHGTTSIGCIIQGVKNGEVKRCQIFNICDHATCNKEVNAQAVSYTTGTPASIGAQLMLKNVWRGAGVFNVETFDPDPFMEKLSQQGLPWQVEWLRPE